MTLTQLFAGTLVALVAGTLVGQVLRRIARSDSAQRTVSNINQRIAVWWVLCAFMAAALVSGRIAVCALFAAFSWLGAREFQGTERRASWLLSGFTAAQYVAVWAGWQLGFAVLIPAIALIAIPRQFPALIVATYGLSFTPALLTLPIPGHAGRNTTLLYYLLIVVEASDILQYICGKLWGRHRIAPKISPNKTWEGLAGGIVMATALGTALYLATPFTRWQAAAICGAVTFAGFGGGLALSAVKRERGIKDFGTLLPGHGGVLDRVDSLCFAAPVFWLIVRLWFTAR
ncbi:MAG TPA: phosphatidate cytidylyltransferase [Bryobacteraceae bacterium]|nr:phosphatidate cytidylyltransferase [Bryobacteraceae bacterium]